MIKYYDWIKQKGGIQSQMRLAMKTAIPSAKAESLPDTQSALEKMHQAVKEITGVEPPKF